MCWQTLAAISQHFYKFNYFSLKRGEKKYLLFKRPPTLIASDMWAGSNHHCFSHNTNWRFKGFAQTTVTPNDLFPFGPIRKLRLNGPEEETGGKTLQTPAGITNLHHCCLTASSSRLWSWELYPVALVIVCMLVINGTVTQTDVSLWNQFYIIAKLITSFLKHRTWPGVVAGNCLIVLTLGLRTARKVWLWAVPCASDWPNVVKYL